MTHFIKEEFKKWSVSSLFMAMAAMAVVLWSPAGVLDNLKDIWNSPDRLEAIENDINRINERLSLVTLDEQFSPQDKESEAFRMIRDLRSEHMNDSSNRTFSSFMK